jgi:hypothetical protein
MAANPIPFDRVVCQMGDTVKRIRNGLVLVAALVTFSSLSFAMGTSEQRAACTPDVFRLCSSEIPNVDRIVVCLKQQKPNLSKPCQAVMNSPIAYAAR